MQFKTVKGFNGLAQLGILLLMLGLGLVITGVLQLLIGRQMVPANTPFNGMSEAIITAMKNPAHVGLTRLMQVLGSFCMMLLPAFGYLLVCHGRNSFWLGFNKYLNPFQVMIAFLIIFTGSIMASPLEELSKAVIAHFPSINNWAHTLEQSYNEQVLIISNLKNWGEFLLAILIMAFLPALFEEVFFRGALQNLLVRWWRMPLLAIFASSVLFSLVHASVYLFLSRLVLGFVLGYLFYVSKNIWVNVIAHFLNNLLALAQLFALSRNNKSVLPSEAEPKVEWWLGVIALLSLLVLFGLLKKYSEKNRLRIYAREQTLLAQANSQSSIA